ncbi:class IIb bacteriocin, lactobin A/cerein 7B family [Caldicellulosiruptor naganoensis]|uniref:Class IIb bacteriocin, lactobin A/cerein 7B family n=1 Tax=Caldicellulosiruptor naganoensis TaxID=29324 RepID=A0ABY7BGJ9_9FIRM|nr:class IIb bacteriocin, lactobin A/cerein 7B family [Caldicellulosiruptor naganoensis]WAM31709.1 class IIb bacteriocin, lactobin A/cerein 7B family [Caldicellulosiruptor naganoensis]
MVTVMPMNEFIKLTEEDLMMIDGGVSGWGIACGVFTIVAGACAVVGGVAAMFAPEPVATKVVGYSAIVGGIATIGAGITGIMWALE